MPAERPTRRTFVAGAATLGAAGALGGSRPALAASATLVHHVFFWLKNPDSVADRDALISGLRTLEAIETVRGIHIGVPASTELREVVDNSFSVSEVLWFDDVAGQDAYQVHPVHQAFVENCSHLWRKVVVYDAIAV
jgi:hypothetical protein